MMRRWLKIILAVIAIPVEWLFILLFGIYIYILFTAFIHPPEVNQVTIGKRTKLGPNHFVLGDNYLKKNEFGVWELYVEGEPYERGLIYGELAQELIQEQEDIFVNQINQFVPSKAWQQMLKLFIGFFNKALPEHIPLENQQEIFGISQFFGDQYDYIAPKYMRILNYHAAHDIGHALNDYSMVGCTSFAVQGEKTKNSHLLIGRNFDFYVGDEFAKEKVLLLINPTDGYRFASYSWAGFTGIASGMNEKGLSVTINASKSDLPTGAKTPISLLAREIVQYASTLEEAIAIARKRETFVSETLLVASRADNTVVLIEKSPAKIGIKYMNQSSITCANHYQSIPFLKDANNQENIQTSDSKYRFDRVNELLATQSDLTPLGIATILRDQKGSENRSLGMGNPRAINQLIAHHSVVIDPQEYRMFISTSDFQLGKMIGINLLASFQNKTVTIDSIIHEDPFIHSHQYAQFKKFKITKKAINDYLLFSTPLALDEEEISKFIANNPESYETYELLGRYFQKKQHPKRAITFYQKALTKLVVSPADEQAIKKRIKLCQNQRQ